MKCIKNPATGDIKRVPDQEAFSLAEEGWGFCPKHEWKQHVRINWQEKPAEPEEASEDPVDKPKKGKKKTTKGKPKSKYRSKVASREHPKKAK